MVEPFTGIIEEFVNGVLQSEEEYKNGFAHGFNREFYPSGGLRLEYYWYFNQFHGEYKKRNEGGTLIDHHHVRIIN